MLDSNLSMCVVNKKFSYRKQTGHQQCTHRSNSKFSLGFSCGSKHIAHRWWRPLLEA